MQTSTSRYLFLILALLAVLFGARNSPSRAQAGSVTPTAPPDAAFQFRQIHMFSKTNGWAVAVTPDPHSFVEPDSLYKGRIGYVLHTQDGGQTWVLNSPPIEGDNIGGENPECDCTTNLLAGFFFLDDRHVWVALDDGFEPQHQSYLDLSLWQTSDAHSWNISTNGLDARFVIAMSFVDAMHGWLLLGGQYGSGLEQPAWLYGTTVGHDWKLLADDGWSSLGGKGPISRKNGITSALHTGLAFESAKVGWLTWSIDAEADDNGGLFRTRDGGKTWYRVPMPHDSPLGDGKNQCKPSNPQVLGPGTVTFLAFCFGGGTFDDDPLAFLYRTTNDGQTWQSVALPANVMVSGPLAPWVPQLFMINAMVGWLVGDEGAVHPFQLGESAQGLLTLYQTVDGAKTWTKIAPLPGSFQGVPNPGGFPALPTLPLNFIDDHQGWAINNVGQLLTTNDAGKTWTALSAHFTPQSD